MTERAAREPELRGWQKRALAYFERTSRPDFLAVATPGAGKTTFALTAIRRTLAARRAGKVVVVAPTQHLKAQWAAAAARLGIRLDPAWSASNGALPRDLHGIVTTYQQVAQDPTPIAGLAKNAFVVLDEIHHAGDAKAWGDAVKTAFEPAARRLGLSGTPFRSDRSAIPFVRYRDHLAVADFEYGYGDALGDRDVVRPVYFPRIDGEMEWTAPDGSHHRTTFRERLGKTLSNQRLRTALSADGEWLPAVLAKANDQLHTFRKVDRTAGGLVIAMDQDHARAVAGMLESRLGVRAVVAVSDDAEASASIGRFAAGSDPWIVAVRMVSEGVDVPRLRVGVYATHTTTDLFFRQAVGRLVRWRSGLKRQPACFFLPDDFRLRTWAAEIREQRRHCLLRPPEAEDGEGDRPPVEREEASTEDQLSLFAPISSTALGVDGLPEEDLGFALESEVDEAAPPEGDATPVPEGLRTRSDREWLRFRNAESARQIARRTKQPFALVNAQLNQRAGVKRITEATEDELARRLKAAETWLSSL